MCSAESSSRELSYAEALYEATRQEMARDDSVFVFGLGVNDAKGMYGTTSALHDEFGAARNFDTPLSEDAMTGVAIGAALAGMSPEAILEEWSVPVLAAARGPRHAGGEKRAEKIRRDELSSPYRAAISGFGDCCGRLHGKGYTLGGNLLNTYVCSSQLAGAGRSPACFFGCSPPSHGTSMHNPRLKSDPG